MSKTKTRSIEKYQTDHELATGQAQTKNHEPATEQAQTMEHELATSQEPSIENLHDYGHQASITDRAIDVSAAASASAPVRQSEPDPSAAFCGQMECSIEKALDVLGGKWTFLIIRDLFDGPRRFGELRQSLDGVSPKTLSSRLRDLEQKNILTRTAYATIPPTVVYQLTEKGLSLKPIVKAMKKWGAVWG